MKRSASHIIQDEAEKIFRLRVPSPNVTREQNKDYGIDFEVEVFQPDDTARGSQTTGFIFKVQVKGTEQPQLSANGKRISFPFEIERAEYLIEQIEIPAAMVLVNTLDQTTYWVNVQKNETLVSDYERAKAAMQKSFTVHFDIKCILPETWNSLIKSMIECADVIALRRVSKVQPPLYADYVQKLDDIKAEQVHLHRKIDISNSEMLRRLIEENQLSQAASLLNQIMRSEERSVEAKFDAVIQSEQLFVKETNQIGAFDKANFDLWQAQQLEILCNTYQVNDRLQKLARGYKEIARLHYLAVRDFQLYMNWKSHEEAQQAGGSTEPIWLLMLPIERTKNAQNLVEQVEVTYKHISELMESGYWEFLPEFLTKISWSLMFFLLRLHEEGLVEATSQVEDWILGLIDFMLELANSLTSQEQIDVVLFRSFIFELQLLGIFYSDLPRREKAKQEATKILGRLKDPSLRLQAENELQQRLVTLENPKPKTDWAGVENYYRNQAQALGIDLSLADDPNLLNSDDTNAHIAWIINIGIRDINPTRVLKNCKYLVFEFTGGVGMPAQMLRLPSATRKTIGCVKHLEHGGIEHYSLDDIYERFRSNYCATCQDAQPHDTDWEYSEDWYKNQVQLLHKEQERLRADMQTKGKVK